jgi:hypothetical protein
VLAGVGFGAVTDAGGSENPEGSAAVTTAAATAAAAHTTAAPDVQNVTRVGDPCEGCTVNQRAVDISFDEKAYTTADGLTVDAVLTDGSVVSCDLPDDSDDTTASGTGDPGGNGTTTLTVLCDAVQDSNTGSTFTAVSTSNIARVIVYSGSVSDADTGGNTNPDQVTLSPDADATTLPDLTKVTFTHGTTTDKAVFTFDRTIVDPGSDGDFWAYDGDGATISPNGDAPILSPDSKSLEIHFASGELDPAVGGVVDSGGVTSASGTDPQSNELDEEGAVSSGAAAVTPGSTIAPDLTNVIVAVSKDSFGQVSDVNVAFIFDENVDSATGTSFDLYNAGGDQADCLVVQLTADSSSIPANTVNCNYQAMLWDAVEGGSHAGNTVTLADAQTFVLGAVEDGAACDAVPDCSPESAKVASKVNI